MIYEAKMLAEELGEVIVKLKCENVRLTERNDELGIENAKLRQEALEAFDKAVERTKAQAEQMVRKLYDGHKSKNKKALAQANRLLRRALPYLREQHILRESVRIYLGLDRSAKRKKP